MTSWRRLVYLFSNFVWLARLPCLGVLVYFSSYVNSLSPSSSLAVDTTPRAALVTLVHDYDLEPLLSSIHQLEDAFNKKYNYDWVFFSTEPLSDEFRRITSNATSSTCVYEVVRQDEAKVHRWQNDRLNQEHLPSQTSQDAPSPTRGDVLEPRQTFRQLKRWNNGPFAKEKRLQTYEWFWRIEPGVSIHPTTYDSSCTCGKSNVALGSIYT